MRWAGAAGSLAQVWEVSGHLIVPSNDWTLAVEQAFIYSLSEIVVRVNALYYILRLSVHQYRISTTV